jgi:hypothetical protein
MKPLLVDTNILLRFITGEPADQAKEAADLVAAAEAGKVRLAVLPMVRSEAWASQPMRAASKGMEPPPQKESPTRGTRPKRRWPSSRMSSGMVLAAVPRWALIFFQASGDGPSMFSGRWQKAIYWS